jgi:hypothetical protein
MLSPAKAAAVAVVTVALSATPVAGQFLTTFGQLVLGPGGTQNFDWLINDATYYVHEGPPPPPDYEFGWGLLSAEKKMDPLTGQLSSGNLSWSATSMPAHEINMSLQTLVYPAQIGNEVPGPMINFDPNSAYKWKFVEWQGTYAGPTDDATLTATVNFDLSNFLNPHPGTFSLYYDGLGEEIDLVYSPVPEPSALALLAVAAGAGVAYCRRRRS